MPARQPLERASGEAAARRTEVRAAAGGSSKCDTTPSQPWGRLLLYTGVSASAQTRGTPNSNCEIRLFFSPRGFPLEIRNRLLASLRKEDLKFLGRHLREVAIEQGEMLEEPGGFVDAVYFPQSGMISLVVQMPEDSTVEVGMVGSEGAIGMTVGLGSRASFISALVQVSGSALCIPASRFRTAANQSAHIRDLIVRYSELQLGQIQQTAGCNALHDVSGRLSRWLLQTSDKIDSDVIPFTHEFLGDMLGVRRSTISQTIAGFHGAGLLNSHRGQITLLKREALKKKACPCYEILRRHTDRLAAPSHHHD
jgi:CRP-like cAMP-binding protein